MEQEQKVIEAIVSSENTKTNEEHQETVVLGTRQEGGSEVHTEFGLTINLGNFNSTRIAASVSIPCKNDAADVAKAFEEAWSIVTKQVAERKKKLGIKGSL
jgi:hypothetical protein